MTQAIAIYAVRHAASLPAAEGGDRARELSETGVARAAELGRQLAPTNFDATLASSATRVQQTLAAIEAAQPAGLPAKQVADSFYDAGPQEWLAALAELPATATRVLLVGHNPTLSLLASMLTGTDVHLRAGDCVVLAGMAAWSGLAAASLRQAEKFS